MGELEPRICGGENGGVIIIGEAIVGAEVLRRCAEWTGRLSLEPVRILGQCYGGRFFLPAEDR